MDAEDIYPASYEQTLPVLSRSPRAAPWPVADPIPHPDDPYTISPTSLPPDLQALDTTPPTQTQSPPKPSQPVQTPTAERNASSKVRKPRKAANATAGKSTLFWVNTDPQSATGGNKEETLKRIRSHVMSEHNRKKRLENTKRYKSKSYKHMAFQAPETAPGTFGAPRPSLPLPASSSSSSSSNSRRSSHVVEHVPASQELVPATSATVDYHDAAPTETWDESWDDNGYDGVVGFPARSTPASLWSYVGTGAHDPFNTGHTQLTDRMMRHLQNCKLYSKPESAQPLTSTVLWDLTQEAHPLQMRYKPKLQAHWAALIQRDPAILHATICMSTSNAAMQRGELPIRDPSQERSALVVDTFHHRGETIRLVNEGLSDPVKASSDELIAAVSTLLTIEVSDACPW